MAIRCNLRQAVIVAAMLLIPATASAQEPSRLAETTPANPEQRKANGILTDRLKKSQFKAWQSILGVILARDRQGRLLHPKLHGLYQQAERCRPGIRIELSMHISPYGPVAWCKTRQESGSVQEEPVVIRLNLGLIDGAVTSSTARRMNGFIPFAGLGKKERYAEALGHELAHAVRFLMNPEYMGYYEELDRIRRIGGSNSNDETIRRLISLIEEPAESAETEVWRELTAGREPKL